MPCMSHPSSRSHGASSGAPPETPGRARAAARGGGRLVPVLLAAGLVVPAGVSLATATTGEPEPAQTREPSSLRRQLDATQVGLRDATDRIVALEGLRQRDARALDELRRALKREREARVALEERTEQAEAEVETHQQRTEAVRLELAGEDEAIRSELLAQAQEEAGRRSEGDRRNAWAVGGAGAFSLLLVGALWWWTRHETRVLRVRIHRVHNGHPALG